jgi:hypothetical protein
MSTNLHQGKFLAGKTEEAIKACPYLKPLSDKLLSMGGRFVILCNGHNERVIVRELMDRGRTYGQARLTRVKGEPRCCHKNVARLAGKNTISCHGKAVIRT